VRPWMMAKSDDHVVLASVRSRCPIGRGLHRVLGASRRRRKKYLETSTPAFRWSRWTCSGPCSFTTPSPMMVLEPHRARQQGVKPRTPAGPFRLLESRTLGVVHLLRLSPLVAEHQRLAIEHSNCAATAPRMIRTVLTGKNRWPVIPRFVRHVRHERWARDVRRGV
jgi:hypothetical protein